MGDVNQLVFVRRFAEMFEAPFLEVGSKDHGSTEDLRALFAGRGLYVGVDMQDGPGVDLVLDVTGDFDQLDAALGRRRFGTIFCLSVLEHCRRPFELARNLTSLLKPGGRICISAPFSWKFHAYPGDYWRFTPQGIELLFPDLRFDAARCAAATSRPNELFELDGQLGRIRFSFSGHRNSGHTWRGITAKALKLFSRLGILSWLTGYRYLQPPTNIMMIGTLKSPQGAAHETAGLDK